MFFINYRSRVPIYLQLYKDIVKQISHGVISEQEALPTVGRLSSHLAINPSMVSKAFNMLENDGIVYSTGKGLFISPGFSAVSKQRRSAIDHYLGVLKQAHKVGIEKKQLIAIINLTFQEQEALHEH